MHYGGLSTTLDHINDLFFVGMPPTENEKIRAARWITARQVQSGRDAGLFVPCADDSAADLLFTGEKLWTTSAVRYVRTAEACRSLLLLGRPLDTCQPTLERAYGRLLATCFADDCVMGECAHATLCLMRLLAVGGLPDADARLERHLATLRQYRDGKGHWVRFPFYYTLLALSEIDTSAAICEKRYAAAACQCFLRRTDVLDARRSLLMERIIAQV